jgi:hypothetical protein
MHATTPLGTTGPEWAFTVGSWNKPYLPDLVAVQKSGTGSGRAEAQVINFPVVELDVPYGSPQDSSKATDEWTCGPHSVSRVLQFYGANASYSSVKTVAEMHWPLFLSGLGSRRRLSKA